MPDPGRIRYSNLSLRYLIMAAYGVEACRLSAPAPADAKALDASYEISAGLPPGSTRAQLSAMLQNLLAERFHLALRREQRIMPVFSLEVAKSGPRLKPSTQPAPPAAANFDPLPSPPPNELELDAEGFPMVPPREGSWLVALRSGRARMHQLNASMADLAALLSKQILQPVADKTGLPGRYEFTLTWVASVPTAGDSGPDLATALREQLGLSLRSSKAPVEVLIVEHIDKRPTEN